jgi:hypothetical protein
MSGARDLLANALNVVARVEDANRRVNMVKIDDQLPQRGARVCEICRLASGSHGRGRGGGEVSGSVDVRTEADAVILTFNGSSEWKSDEQHVPLMWTRCHFGGAKNLVERPASRQI